MTCDTLDPKISNLIEQSLLFAGAPINGVSDGRYVKRSVTFLNQILGMWSTKNIYLPYSNSYTFAAFDNRIEYKIGPGQDLDTNRFVIIDSVTYLYGTIVRPVKYEPKKSFDNYVYLNGVGWPSIYTYQQQKDYMIFKMLPRAFPGMPITINGKQAMSDVTLFTNTDTIPSYMQLPLTYELASQLIATGVGKPAANFADNYKAVMKTMKAASIIDTQSEVSPPIENIGAAVPLGTYGGGIFGGGYGGGY